MKAIEHLLEVLIFNSRWLLAPFYLGLVIGIVLLLVKFGQELIHAIPNIFAASESEVVLAVLALVDLSLVANLLHLCDRIAQGLRESGRSAEKRR